MISAYIGVDGFTYRELQRPRFIKITRVEGPTELCDEPYVCGRWSEAHSFLSKMSKTAPEDGSYHKHDFRIEWPNGFVYEGRYDLVHWRKAQPDLAGHVRDMMVWLADPMNEALVNVAVRESAAEALVTLDVYQPAVPIPEGEIVHIVRDYRMNRSTA